MDIDVYEIYRGLSIQELRNYFINSSSSNERKFWEALIKLRAVEVSHINIKNSK